MDTFEPIDPFNDLDESDEIQEKPLKRVVLAGVALLGIVLLLYLSGIYQLNLLTETSRLKNINEMTSLVEAEELTLPLTFVVIREENDNNVEVRDIEHIVLNASRIWNQADIAFVVDDIHTIDLAEESASVYIDEPERIPSQFRPKEDRAVRVFLVDALGGLNGVAFRGAQSVAVSRYTSFTDYRTLAHEIGHILDLEHVSDSGRLMSSGGTGFELTLEEVETARNSLNNLK